MYKKMYLTLFNALTDALDQLEKGHPAAVAAILRTAQQNTEDQYIEADVDEDKIVPFTVIESKRQQEITE